MGKKESKDKDDDKKKESKDKDDDKKKESKEKDDDKKKESKVKDDDIKGNKDLANNSNYIYNRSDYRDEVDLLDTESPLCKNIKTDFHFTDFKVFNFSNKEQTF